MGCVLLEKEVGGGRDVETVYYLSMGGRLVELVHYWGLDYRIYYWSMDCGIQYISGTWIAKYNILLEHLGGMWLLKSRTWLNWTVTENFVIISLFLLSLDSVAYVLHQNSMLDLLLGHLHSWFRCKFSDFDGVCFALFTNSSRKLHNLIFMFVHFWHYCWDYYFLYLLCGSIFVWCVLYLI